MKNRPVFRAEAADICGIDPKTWDKYVKRGDIKVAGTTPPAKKWHWLFDVIEFKKRILKNRRKGLPLVILDLPQNIRRDKPSRKN